MPRGARLPGLPRRGPQLAACKTLASRSLSSSSRACPIPDRLPALQQYQDRLPAVQAGTEGAPGCPNRRWLPIYYSCYCIATMLVLVRSAEHLRPVAATGGTKREKHFVISTRLMEIACRVPTTRRPNIALRTACRAPARPTVWRVALPHRRRRRRLPRPPCRRRRRRRSRPRQRLPTCQHEARVD